MSGVQLTWTGKIADLKIGDELFENSFRDPNGMQPFWESVMADEQFYTKVTETETSHVTVLHYTTAEFAANAAAKFVDGKWPATCFTDAAARDQYMTDKGITFSVAVI